ncbi:MFS transporter [Altererythrobacter sp. CC-YST694]|uniref:MFS transporter n=1 Tax=Altererythrobacter sp. CC-YST694 TaxID=2755038 RepID=UPI001D0347B2|nr:MFS transporter [Altererythrobacter sp. CC-YST694]MCB5424298.1 MFS transporter [Altererythrobacter sp. CC-YST694]
MAGRVLADDPAFEAATYRKVAMRLVPLLFLGYFVAILDRVNVGFAKLQMASDLELGDAVYGFGAGIFFIGYFFFELPSNLILARVGARRWIARIMITWGAISAGFMFLGHLRWGPLAGAFGLSDAEFSFYLLRFILGLAEAGFFPGVILYLTFWFPAARRAHVVALFLVAIPLASALGAPVSGAILQFFDGTSGMRGWQWLFLLEGIPSVLVGLIVLARLPDRPADARWLSGQERALVEGRLAEDEARKADHGQRHALREVFTDWRIWALALADFLRAIINNALNFWMPTLVQEIGIDKGDYFRVGLVTAIPWSLAAIAMVLCARHSDRTGERRWHATGALLVSMVGLLMLAFAQGAPLVTVTALTMIAAGAMAWLAVFWTLPTAFLSGAAAAGGIAWINALSQLGGYVGPDMLGRIRESNNGNGADAFLLMALAALVAAWLTWLLAGARKKQTV